MSKKKGKNEEVKEEAVQEETGTKEETGEAGDKAAEEAAENKNENTAEGKAEDTPKDTENEASADTGGAEPEAAEEEAKTAEKETSKGEDPKDKKIAELNDKVVRQMAEFDNFRKRTEKEKSEMFANGEKSVIEAILPVIDNFERALEMAAQDETKKDDPFMDGMDKVYKQLMGELEKLGVTSIEALGADFDPNLHNAVMQEETEEYESGKVCKELQKGY
ncbi:MAG: nucleotide exchange factor GrpE, partial [Lachnospiraceae bacterium]|nr:nucleotide exchange factor GrpE [Lachnospiraceae bacterium]